MRLCWLLGYLYTSLNVQLSRPFFLSKGKIPLIHSLGGNIASCIFLLDLYTMLAPNNTMAKSQRTRIWPAAIIVSLFFCGLYIMNQGYSEQLRQHLEQQAHPQLDESNDLFEQHGIKYQPDGTPSVDSKPLVETVRKIHQDWITLPKGWEFDLRRDGEDYGLSDAQCQAAFPKQYWDIDTMTARFKNRHITREQLDEQSNDKAVKAMIFDGELYIISAAELEYPGTRGLATIHAINRALVAIPPEERRRLPNSEFMIWVWDRPNGAPVFSYTKHNATDADEGKDDSWNAWLMPDFGMYDWADSKDGSWTEARRRMRSIEEEMPFDQKEPKMYWRGTNHQGVALRNQFVEASAGKWWSDIGEFDQFHKDELKEDLRPIGDFCKYQFTGHVSGFSWSGAGKYVHNCRSVFITHPVEWMEVYTPVLQSSGPEQNYVEAKADWSDLEAKVVKLLANPKKAEKIAENQVKVLRDRYLTPAAQACYWRRLLQGYGSVSFEPRFFEEDGETWRAVPFESVAMVRKTSWDPYERNTD